MTLARLFQAYLPAYKARYGHTTSADQWSALNAILGCRTGQYGHLMLSCQGCHQPALRYQSCGHRACNQCQHHSASQWLERQQRKLLPVDYFMATFTLPRELRALAKDHPKQVYSLLFDCAVSTLKDFGLNKKSFAAELAMTAVLHTHTRRLDYHPHVHIILPGGGVQSSPHGKASWKTLSKRYLFNGRALAKVFRARLLAALRTAGFAPPMTPKQWVVQCQSIRRGLPALQYLSRYLYRGVISDKNILRNDGETVTFQYRDSKTGKMKTRSLRGEEFMALVLQHTLPKGFRRARDYGFLHGNAKRLLQRVQWALQIMMPAFTPKPRPVFTCLQCQCAMSIVGFIRPRPAPQ